MESSMVPVVAAVNVGIVMQMLARVLEVLLVEVMVDHIMQVVHLAKLTLEVAVVEKVHGTGMMKN